MCGQPHLPAKRQSVGSLITNDDILHHLIKHEFDVEALRHGIGER